MTITSLLDNDLYQFSMSACLWQHGLHDLKVRYEFRNRTFSVPLANRLDLDILKLRIEDIRHLGFTAEELVYLSKAPYWPAGWLDYLADIELPPVIVGSDHGHLVLQYEGPIGYAIFWETILLALVNESYFSRFSSYLGEGEARLAEKIGYLNERGTLIFAEFGTRRRFSKDWQHRVVHKIVDEIPHLLGGTSNVALAREFNIPVIGTMAHQMFMVFTALWRQKLIDLADHTQQPYSKVHMLQLAIEDAQSQVLTMWLETFGSYPEMLTALPDTYGTPQFFEGGNPDQIYQFSAFRQDSGDPLHIADYLFDQIDNALGNQKIIFSDGLDVRKMSVIEDHMKKTGLDCRYGWGTDLTNDLGYEPLSIVIKPAAVERNGVWLPCVKISDDIQKATGDPEAVAEYLEAVDRFVHLGG